MVLTGAEVAKHNNKDSVWVIVHGKVYDVTEFAPGNCDHTSSDIIHWWFCKRTPRWSTDYIQMGRKGCNWGMILFWRDRELSHADCWQQTYEPIHPPDTLDKYLDKSKHLGDVDMGTVKKEKEETDEQEIKRQDAIAHMPILEQCYNLMDFESVARRVMKKTAWAYCEWRWPF